MQSNIQAGRNKGIKLMVVGGDHFAAEFLSQDNAKTVGEGDSSLVQLELFPCAF
jgi:hypothetical protein